MNHNFSINASYYFHYFGMTNYYDISLVEANTFIKLFSFI